MMNNLSPRENEAAMMKPATAEPPDFLVRSRKEVLRLLNSMVTQEAPLSMSLLNAGRTLVSSLIFVDESSNTLLLAYPPEWETTVNPGADAIMLGCVVEDSKIEFQGSHCAIVDLEGAPVVGMAIPEFMWRFQRRRDARHKVSGLTIELNMGFLQADAEIVDLSVSGIGILNCHSDLKLDDGEVLPGCSIALPGMGQIPVDLVVKYQTEAQLEDGRPVVRAGCQFSGLSDRARQMIAHYLEALAEH